MRILQLSRWLISEGGGGVQTSLSSLSKAFRTADVRLEYAALMAGSAPSHLVSSARLGSNAHSKRQNASSLRRWLRREVDGFNLVHIHGATDWHFLVGALVCHRRGVPYLVSPSGGLFPDALSQTLRRRIVSHLALKFVGLRLLSRAHLVIATSAREQELLRSLDKRIRVKIIPHGVSVPESCPSNARVERGRFRLLFIGRLSPIKSLPTLFEAMAKLCSDGQEVSLDIVGSGSAEYVDELLGLTRRLGIDDYVTWHGYQSGEKKQQLLREAHVLVLPSLSENFGFVVAEAMASGMPVVVSDGVGVADQVRRYRAGSVFPVADENALAAALSVFLDPLAVREYGARAYSCAVAEFSLEAMGKALLEVYREAADSKKVSSS